MYTKVYFTDCFTYHVIVALNLFAVSFLGCIMSLETFWSKFVVIILKFMCPACLYNMPEMVVIKTASQNVCQNNPLTFWPFTEMCLILPIPWTEAVTMRCLHNIGHVDATSAHSQFSAHVCSLLTSSWLNMHWLHMCSHRLVVRSERSCCCTYTVNMYSWTQTGGYLYFH